jgi:hypothetical protein
MKSHNEELYENALIALTALFSDQSVSKRQTRVNLEDVIDEIDDMLDSLKD